MTGLRPLHEEPLDIPQLVTVTYDADPPIHLIVHAQAWHWLPGDSATPEEHVLHGTIHSRDYTPQQLAAVRRATEAQMMSGVVPGFGGGPVPVHFTAPTAIDPVMADGLQLIRLHIARTVRDIQAAP